MISVGMAWIVPACLLSAYNICEDRTNREQGMRVCIQPFSRAVSVWCSLMLLVGGHQKFGRRVQQEISTSITE